MAWPVYSALLAAADSVGDTPTNLGGPPEGYVWVARFIAATFGFYVGYIGMAFSVGGEAPWLWLTQTGSDSLFGVHDFTLTWEGRLVIPQGATLWAKASTPDTGDVLVSGYQLLAAP